MPRPALTPFAQAATGEVEYLGEMAPGVHAYGITQAMGRVRAYQTAGLGPFAGRGLPQEKLLVGHIHTDSNGKVTHIEGFNGGSGERFAHAARDVLHQAGLLTPETAVEPTKGLRLCPYTGY